MAMGTLIIASVLGITGWFIGSGLPKILKKYKIY
jgi:hypothetical protein